MRSVDAQSSEFIRAKEKERSVKCLGQGNGEVCEGPPNGDWVLIQVDPSWKSTRGTCAALRRNRDGELLEVIIDATKVASVMEANLEAISLAWS